MEARGDPRKNKKGEEEIENGIWARRWDLDQGIDQRRGAAWKSPERRGVSRLVGAQVKEANGCW